MTILAKWTFSLDIDRSDCCQPAESVTKTLKSSYCIQTNANRATTNDKYGRSWLLLQIRANTTPSIRKVITGTS